MCYAVIRMIPLIMKLLNFFGAIGMCYVTTDTAELMSGSTGEAHMGSC